MTVEVRKLEGSGTIPFGVPFRNVYILNDGGKGWIRINDTLKLDIEKIDRVEGLTIKKLEWNLTSDGNAVFVILSHEKLSTEYITRLMLSRIYSELQTKSSKKKIVYVNASSSTTVPAGSSETITIRPPTGKLWRLRGFKVDFNKEGTESTGEWRFRLYTQDVHIGVRAHFPYSSTGVKIFYSQPRDASAIYPSSPSDFHRRSTDGSLVASSTYPFIILIENNTDVAMTNARVIHLIVEEEDEAT